MNIEDVVNSTARAVLDFWLRHWPICLLTLWAVLELWDIREPHWHGCHCHQCRCYRHEFRGYSRLLENISA
ncbi:hypothetical protein [Desulfovibrio falkowii]|uniref:hypothetical protein n=1 Tax=Desulfovibrio falkowii TaxID=3136602 RepID=UPI0038B264AF